MRRIWPLALALIVAGPGPAFAQASTKVEVRAVAPVEPVAGSLGSAGSFAPGLTTLVPNLSAPALGSPAPQALMAPALAAQAAAIPVLPAAAEAQPAGALGAVSAAAKSLAAEPGSPEPALNRLYESADLRPEAPPIGPRRAEELKRWGNRYRSSVGPLLNPPAGKVDPRIRLAEERVRGIVEKLAGGRLRAEGRQLIVSVFPDEQPNAFMAKVRWPGRGEDAPKRPVLLRRYGLDAKRPAYELGITQGLLRLMETEDELAFVVAHELQHMLEGHVDGDKHASSSSKAKGWWSAQRHEAVADHLALKMMLGRYDLEAGLTALAKLHPPEATQAPDEDGLDALMADHHHEGVRLSLAQSYIEYLRRTEPDAQPRPRAALPKEFGRGAFSRRKNLDDPSREKLFAALDKTMNALLSKDVRPNPGVNDLPSDASADDVKALLHRGLDRVERSSASAQRKGDAALGLVQLLVGRYELADSARASAVFDAQARLRLQKALLAAAKAPRGWQSRAFYRWQASGMGPVNGAYRKALDFTTSPELRGLFSGLSRVHPEWARFVASFVREGSVDARGRFEMDTSMIGEMLKLEEGTALQAELLRQVLEFLSGESFQEAMIRGLRARDGDAFGVLKQLAGEDRPDLREAMRPVEDAFLAERELLVDQLARGPADTKSAQALFQSLDLSAAYPWNIGGDRRLARALLAVARHMSEKDFFESAGFMSAGLTRALYRSASSPEFTERERLLLLKVIAASRRFYRSYSGGEEDRPLVEELRSALGRLSAAETLALVHEPLPSVDRRIADLLGDADFMKSLQERAALTGSLHRKNGPRRKESVARALDRIRVFDRKIAAPLRALTSALENRLSARLSPLTMLGADRTLSETIASRVPLQGLKALAARVDRAWEELEADYRRLNDKPWFPDADGIKVSASAGLFLLDVFRGRQSEIADVEEWSGLLRQLDAFNATSLDMRPQFKPEFESRFLGLTEGAGAGRRYDLARRDHIAKVLSLDTLVRIATEEAARRVEAAPDQQSAAAAIRSVEDELKMKDKRPDLYHDFREALAERLKVQPARLAAYFPAGSERVDTKSTENYSLEVRGLSAFAALARPQPVGEQIRLLEYLMGRAPDPPAFIEAASHRGDRYIPLSDILRNVRMRLAKESWLKRAFVLNSFLAGPSSVLEREADRKALLDHLLRPVSAGNKPLASDMAGALLRAQGPMKSLAAAYILAQKPAEEGRPLSEGEIIRSLFEAFGAAGIKLGQYLAFTAELNGYQQELAQLQDAALPLSYLQTVRLISERLGGSWPESWRIVGTLGSGSVNVAVEYFDGDVRKTKVVSLLRSDIRTAAREDFRKLQAFVAELVKLDEGRDARERRFSHLPGLLAVIERSVVLEFDKERTLDVQNRAEKFYRRSRDGWTLRSVRADWARDGALSMDKAAGRTARKVRRENPALYAKSMRLVLHAELDLLFGAGADGRPHPARLFANPDLHDGQVLIDEASKSVAILDFGQALEITDGERALGVAVLRVISGRESPASMRALISELSGSSLRADDEELSGIAARRDRMDRFVHLLSMLEGKGVRLPLSSVHWVLGVNRAIQLGKNVGYPVEAELYGLILADRAGLSHETFLKLRRWVRSLPGVRSKL